MFFYMCVSVFVGETFLCAGLETSACGVKCSRGWEYLQVCVCVGDWIQECECVCVCVTWQ